VLARPRTAPHTVVVRVLDTAGRPLPETEVRTRYGGEWLRVNSSGEARLESPRVREGQPDEVAALADALEARGAFHRLRRERHARVSRRENGTVEAEFRLEKCGLLRVGLAMTAFPEARATLDPDPVRDRWRVVEGNDVVRAGQAATWAVFAGAPKLWVTIEGPAGVAQERVPIDPPGAGLLIERTLFPHRAVPIRGRLDTGGVRAASLEGVLEVTETPEAGEPIERQPVKIEPDGTFVVDYAGEARFLLEPRCDFATRGTVAQSVEARGGDEDVRIPVEPLPWIALTTSEPLARPPVVTLSRGNDSQRPRPVLGAQDSWIVSAPGPGPYTLTLSARGADAAPPRSGQARVEVESESPTHLELTLAALPHGTLVVKPTRVPPRGGEAHVLPDRARTLLPREGEATTFKHVSVGKAYVDVRWQDPALAWVFAVADVREGATAEVAVTPEPGAAVSFDVSAAVFADATEPWAFQLASGGTPYGLAEGNVPLRRTLVDGAPTLTTEGALKPGKYRGWLHSTRPDQPPPLMVEFEVALGRANRVVVGPK
jgi:hypothetical protein